MERDLNKKARPGLSEIKKGLLFAGFFLLTALFPVFALSGLTDGNNLEIRNVSRGVPTVLLDIPGVNWSGESREGDWGHLLGLDTETIYVKHAGSRLSPNHWDTTGYDHVVTLSNGQEQELRKLVPAIQHAVEAGKSVHIILDKNISLLRHSTIRKKGEDQWAAEVADFILESTPDSYFKIQAMHSNGTIVPSYMKKTGMLDYAIISSPRGEKGLDLARIRPDMPIDIITGLSDAPSLRLPGSKGRLLKENPNLRIIQLQKGRPWNVSKWKETHSALQNMLHEGKWKILEGREMKEFQGALGQILAPRVHLYHSIEKTPVPAYWTYKGPDQPHGKTMTEARIMTEMVQDKKKVFIVGDGPEARLMYTNMTNRLGQENVKWFKQELERRQMQLEAKKFGADIILGAKEHRPLASASVHTGSVPIAGAKIYDPDTHTPPDMPDMINKAGAGYKGAKERVQEALKHSHDINKARNPEAYGWPGKWGRPGGPLSTDIGGVMLQGVARVSNEADASNALRGGSFSLIFTNAKAEIDIGNLRRFVTALWAVYFSEKGPGISIDPIAPGVDKHLVRYIGNVINSDLGRVMRETDYIMKKWAVGTQKPDIEGFRSVDTLTVQHGLRYLGASRRFWFVPEDMRFKKMGNALLFDSGKMTLKTEYVVFNKGAKAEPADEEFVRVFTEKYSEIANKYPMYGELFEYAKLVSLAGYLKENGVPMLWFLLANKDMVITEDSPGTVDALAKKSDYCEYITIEGGVDLAFNPKPDTYVLDRDAALAINKAISLYGTRSGEGAAALPTQNIIFESGKDDLTLTPSADLTLSSAAAGGEKYQTDLALYRGKEPGLELVRYYDPGYQGPPTFGKGWHLMVPYQVRPHSHERIPFANARIPKKMVVKNLLSGREEVLSFSNNRYRIAGYVPDRLEESNLIGLFPLTDGSFRLADKLGNEFQFHGDGHLAEMILAGNYHVKFEYGYDKAEQKDFAAMPFRIEPVGNEYESISNIGIALLTSMKLVNMVNGEREEFRLDKDNSYGLVGYAPKDTEGSRYAFLGVMSDGSFVLEQKNGIQISFDGGGTFTGIQVRVIKGVSQGDSTVKFEYEFSGGIPRIRKASVTNKDRSKPIHTVKYEYGKDLRLCRIIPSFEQPLKIDYHENRVVLAKR